MLSLNDRKWKEFFIKEIFITEINNRNQIQVPTGSLVDKKYLSIGNEPRITVTSQNNGIYDFYTSQHKGYRVQNNFISVSFLGTIFYHPYQASLDMKVHCLKLKDRELDKYLSLFLITEIKKSIEDSSYGNQLSSTDLPRKKIMLPIDESGKPDYLFMTSYAKQMEKAKKEAYIKYIQKEIVKIIPPHPQLITKPHKWKEFFISGENGIFTIESGKRLESYNMRCGKIPFIGSSDTNNGVTNFISNTNTSLDKNLLGVNYNGSVVNNYYHPYECIFSDDVKRLHLKSGKDNKFVLLFLSTIIFQQKNKYSYGYKFNGARMARQKILLPVDDNNSPNYEYMENSTKLLMVKKYNDYLHYVKNN